MENITIIKRDGSEEQFEKDKIKRVLIAAALAPEQAAELAIEIEKWLIKDGRHTYKSLELRDKILEKLNEMNHDVANLYKWYESTKDTADTT